jgi:PKD repeat protein
MRWIASLIAVLLVVFAGSCAQDNGTNSNAGPAPKITSITPSSINPGTTGVEGRIYGSNFQGVMAVSFGDGVLVQQFTLISNTEIYVFVSVDKTAAPGPRDVIVATTTGANSASGLFNVGDNRVPEAKFIITPFRGVKDTPFRFDASRSDDDGSIVSYKWKFGDGKFGSGRVITHEYKHGGTFDVSLTVTDNKGVTGASSGRVDVDNSKLPLAMFTVSPSSGTIDTTFSFNAAQSHDPDGTIVNYFWNFGDGTSANGQQVQHKYQQQGAFGVTLTVTDNSREANITQRRLDVGTGGGPGGGGGTCTNGASDRGLIYGTVVGVDGFNAIVQFPADATCANTFYKCGDLRLSGASGLAEFFGIVQAMTDLGNGKFSIYNTCPVNWPPQIGASVFLIYKSCSNNFCP